MRDHISYEITVIIKDHISRAIIRRMKDYISKEIIKNDAYISEKLKRK